MLWRLFNSGNGVERYKHGDQPAWALVTGSSDGIGKELATELLSRGFNVFLHGRNAEKLEKLKTELLKVHSERSVEIIVADIFNFDEAQLESVVQQLAGKNLTVLVNNLAWTGGNFDLVQDMSFEDAEKAINMNIRFFTHLTRVLIPILNQPALILNSSSIVAIYPMGYLSMYSATKAYTNALSRALVQEMMVAKHQIEVLAVEIHNSQSSTNPSAHSWHTPTAKTMAKAIVDSVGWGGSSVVVKPYWGHELLSYLLALLGRGRMSKLGTETFIKQYK